jgi:hypothetical protein
MSSAAAAGLQTRDRDLRHGHPVFVVANRYGPQGASDGVVLTERVSVPRAGRP